MLLHHRTCSILLWAADRVLLVSSKTQPALLLITMLPWHAASFYPTENATICPELTDSKPGVKPKRTNLTPRKKKKKKKKKKKRRTTHTHTHTHIPTAHWPSPLLHPRPPSHSADYHLWFDLLHSGEGAERAQSSSNDKQCSSVPIHPVWHWIKWHSTDTHTIKHTHTHS